MDLNNKITLAPARLAICIAAIAIGSLLVVPAAQAVEFTHEGEPIGSEPTLEFAGPGGFESGGAGAHWFFGFKLIPLPPSGTATVFDLTVTSCTGTGLVNSSTCTATPVGLGHWLAHANSDGTLTITNLSFIIDYYPLLDLFHQFPTAGVTLEGNVIATLDEPESFSTASLSGEGFKANGNAATITGDLEVSPAGTYGIG